MSGTRVVVAGVHPLPLRRLQRVVSHVTTGEGGGADISLTFLGPRAMQRLNARHKGHDRPTDVIAFALPEPDGSLTGDIYICRWQAAREARNLGISVREELVRLVVHGTLHVLGWDHPEDDQRTRSPMWQRQEQYVRELTA
jgi:probable rRNA maturation factor